MEHFQLWNNAQKALAIDAANFTDETLIPYAEKCVWKKSFHGKQCIGWRKRAGLGRKYRLPMVDGRKNGELQEPVY